MQQVTSPNGRQECQVRRWIPPNCLLYRMTAINDLDDAGGCIRRETGGQRRDPRSQSTMMTLFPPCPMSWAREAAIVVLPSLGRG